MPRWVLFCLVAAALYVVLKVLEVVKARRLKHDSSVHAVESEKENDVDGRNN